MKRVLVIYDPVDGKIYDKREEPFIEPSDELKHLIIEVEEGKSLIAVDVRDKEHKGIFEEISSPIESIEGQIKEVNNAVINALEMTASLYEIYEMSIQK